MQHHGQYTRNQALATIHKTPAEVLLEGTFNGITYSGLGCAQRYDLVNNMRELGGTFVPSVTEGDRLRCRACPSKIALTFGVFSCALGCSFGEKHEAQD